MSRSECNAYSITSAQPISRSEFTANVQGFNCYTSVRKPVMVTVTAKFNLIKAFGYVVTLLVILAVVVK